MGRCSEWSGIGIALVAGVFAVGTPAFGGTDKADLKAELEALRAKVKRIDALERQVAELRAERHADWLSERQAEQVGILVREVLANAETRSSFLAGGLTAGHDGSHFFLASNDDRFLLELAGHLQVRYTLNSRRDSGDDDHIGGFSIRRAKLKGEGHIPAGDRRIGYAFSLAGDQDRGDPTIFEDYYLETGLADGLAIRAGRWKQPFALQNLRSSSRQLAVERSVVHELFNVDRSEGVMLSWKRDRYQLHGAVNDGRDAEQTDFDQDSTDVAFTGRAEALLAGAWKQFRDASSWSGDDFGAMLGGGVHYEIGETGPAAANDDFLLWTADLSLEGGGVGGMLAGYGFHTDNETGAEFSDFGFLAEAGWMVVPDTLEPFVRYELIIADGDRTPVAAGSLEEMTNILTAGVNWYHVGHDAKLTLDLVYALDPLFASAMGPGAEPNDIGSSSLGLRPDAPGEDGQIAVRAQYQLKF